MLSLGGLIYLLLPGIAAPFDFAQDRPPLVGSLLMLAAGVAGGRVFTARTRGSRSSCRHCRQLCPCRSAWLSSERGCTAVAAIRYRGRVLCRSLGRARFGCRLCDLVRGASKFERHSHRRRAIERAGHCRSRWGDFGQRADHISSGHRLSGDPRWNRACGGETLYRQSSVFCSPTSEVCPLPSGL